MSRRKIETRVEDFVGGSGLVRKNGGRAPAIQSKNGPPRKAGPTEPKETKEHRLKPVLLGLSHQAWMWASMNQRSLSISRVMLVKRSTVIASSRSSASWMAVRRALV